MPSTIHINCMPSNRNHNECCNDSPTPDDAMFRYLASTYAQNHPEMKTGHNCEEVFPDGITNGAHWYELNGGMQGKYHIYQTEIFTLQNNNENIFRNARLQLREHKLL